MLICYNWCTFMLNRIPSTISRIFSESKGCFDGILLWYSCDGVSEKRPLCTFFALYESLYNNFFALSDISPYICNIVTKLNKKVEPIK